MRKTIIAAVILFPTAFMFGVAFQKLYLRSLARYVSPCTVTGRRAIYKTLRGSSLVNVRGFLYGGEVLYLADKDLNGCDESVIGIEIPEDGKIAYESQALIRGLRRLSGKEGRARAEVEVIGELAERGRDCFASRYVIRVQQILPAGPPEMVGPSVLEGELKEFR
ncbi:MAG TPA: hypothetical protein VF668_04825 [Pyrinomonadaceae bacterium]|jgi:hypothetical protein